MEIIKIFIFFGLFWFVSFYNFVTFLCMYNFFSYMKNNKHLIMYDPNPINVMMLFMIIVYEILLINVKLVVLSIHTNQYFSLIIKKLNVINNYYVDCKNTVIKYVLKNIFSKIYLYTIQKINNVRMELRKKINDKEIEENNKEIEENNNEIEENNNKIEENYKEIEENYKKIEENYKEIEQNNKKIEENERINKINNSDDAVNFLKRLKIKTN